MVRIFESASGIEFRSQLFDTPNDTPKTLGSPEMEPNGVGHKNSIFIGSIDTFWHNLERSETGRWCPRRDLNPHIVADSRF